MNTNRAWIGAVVSVFVVAMAPLVPAQTPAPLSASQASTPGGKELAGGLDPDALPSSIPMPAIPAPDAGAPFADYSHAWPARLALGQDGTITLAIDEPSLAWQFRQGRFGPLLPTQRDESDAAAILTAAGVDFNEANIRRAINFEGAGSFVVRFEDGPRQGVARRTPGVEQFLIETLSPAADASDAPKLERTWFVFYAPKRGTNADATGASVPRGIALVMPGVFGTPEGTVEATVASLRSHGWHVLRMLAQPSRFTQRITFDVDLEASDEAMDAKGAQIAAVLSDRAAECAYAVQGAFGHMLAKHAELAQLPRIVIGFSGGAITLPVVVAREPDAYDAAVVVGGGAHYWLINAHSTYADMIAAIAINWTKPPTLEPRRRVADAYLRHAPLDSFHTAAALRGKPTLMIQANADSAVAAVLGDVLWERSGKPDRWIKPGEHLPLFISLIKDLPAINEWLDQHVGPVHAGTGNTNMYDLLPGSSNPDSKELRKVPK